MIQYNLIFAILLGCVSIFVLLNLMRAKIPRYFSNDPDNLKRIIRNQIDTQFDGNEEPALASNSLLQSVEEAMRSSLHGQKIPLERKLKYAGWTLSPLLFRGFALSISLLFFSLATMKFNIIVQCAALSIGPILMQMLLAYSINRRFKAFDKDYAQFLLQIVGLLKTGMSATRAIQEAANGLESQSLVRSEVDLMIKRIRFGINEDKSTGTFAENIDHPEIELFVQALLLSRRLGGNLSDTLERLSKQVRKRQYFRSASEAAIGLQRGSLWTILVMLIGVQGYITLVYPDLILKGLETEVGWHVWQICFVMIGFSFYWISQITKFKV
jgi:tight adherence protein B